MEQLDWRALGEMQQFKGGESGWGRLEVQVLERRRQREPDDEEGHDVCGGEHREGPGCDLRSSDPKARSVAGHER